MSVPPDASFHPGKQKIGTQEHWNYLNFSATQLPILLTAIQQARNDPRLHAERKINMASITRHTYPPPRYPTAVTAPASQQRPALVNQPAHMTLHPGIALEDRLILSTGASSVRTATWVDRNTVNIGPVIEDVQGMVLSGTHRFPESVLNAAIEAQRLNKELVLYLGIPAGNPQKYIPVQTGVAEQSNVRDSSPRTAGVSVSLEERPLTGRKKFAQALKKPTVHLRHALRAVNCCTTQGPVSPVPAPRHHTPPSAANHESGGQGPAGSAFPQNTGIEGTEHGQVGARTTEQSLADLRDLNAILRNAAKIKKPEPSRTVLFVPAMENRAGTSGAVNTASGIAVTRTDSTSAALAAEQSSPSLYIGSPMDPKRGESRLPSVPAANPSQNISHIQSARNQSTTDPAGHHPFAQDDEIFVPRGMPYPYSASPSGSNSPSLHPPISSAFAASGAGQTPLRSPVDWNPVNTVVRQETAPEVNARRETPREVRARQRAAMWRKLGINRPVGGEPVNAPRSVSPNDGPGDAMSINRISESNSYAVASEALRRAMAVNPHMTNELVRQGYWVRTLNDTWKAYQAINAPGDIAGQRTVALRREAMRYPLRELLSISEDANVFGFGAGELPRSDDDMDRFVASREFEIFVNAVNGVHQRLEIERLNAGGDVRFGDTTSGSSTR